MRKPPLAERLLSLATSPDRASALYGDLEELSATRSRLWFWIAYTRVLISLGWRTGGPAFLFSFLCATSSSLNTGLFSSMHWLFRWLPQVYTVYHISFWRLPLANTLMGLIFMLPFVLIRFGLRDRLTQLTCAVSLITLPLFSLRPAAVEFVWVACAVTAVAALCLREWRLPMIILMLSLGARYFLMAQSNRHYRWWLHPQLYATLSLLAFATAAIVCILLHRRLLQPKPPPGGSAIV